MATAKKNIVPTAAEALAVARELVTARVAGSDAARIAHEELTARLDGGDDTIAALDLVLAGAEVDRAERLIPAAKLAVKRAEAAVELEEAQNFPTLAQWLRGLIEKDPFAFGLQGMSVNVVPSVPNNATGPAAFLSQLKPTKTEASTGTMSGVVFLDLVLPDYVKSWDHQLVVNAVRRLVSDAGIAENAFVTSRSQHGAPKVMIEIVKLQPEFPTLPKDAPEKAFKDFGYLVSDEIVKAGGSINRGNGDPRYQVVTSSISASVKTVDPVGGKSDGELFRRRVKVALEVSGRHSASDLAVRIDGVLVGGVTGKLAPWLGRVESGKSLKVDWQERRSGGAQVGNVRAEKCTVTAEFVIVCKLA